MDRNLSEPNEEAVLLAGRPVSDKGRKIENRKIVAADQLFKEECTTVTIHSYDVFRKRMDGGEMSSDDCAKFTTAFLTNMGKEYSRRGWVMQLHYGVKCDNDKRRFGLLGADTGFDSIGSAGPVSELADFLNALAQTDELPKTILYSLNPNDNTAIGTIIGCFQDSSCAGGNNPKAQTDKEYYEPGDIDADTQSFFDLSEEGVDAVFRLNFIGTLLPTQAFAKQMLGRPGCNIINISSMNAFTPLTKIPAYSGAKAAVSNFTQWLAVHFSKEGIRVNAIAPGFFSTKQNAKLLFNEDGTPNARTGKILAATPMGRFGEAKELEGALLFLVNNEAAGFITGVVLPVDGGFQAYSGV